MLPRKYSIYLISVFQRGTSIMIYKEISEVRNFALENELFIKNS